jgi:uncharacterized protein YecT (DUF1311 family)
MMRATTLLFLLYSSISQAQGWPATPAIIAGECLSNKLKNAEAVLAINLNQLQSATPINEPNQLEKAKKLLAESQKNWLVYRNTYCEYKGYVEGGAPPYKGVRKAQCLIQFTAARAVELKAMREFYE